MRELLGALGVGDKHTDFAGRQRYLDAGLAVDATVMNIVLHAGHNTNLAAATAHVPVERSLDLFVCRGVVDGDGSLHRLGTAQRHAHLQAM